MTAPLILAIDPGSERSAWLVFRDGRPVLVTRASTIWSEPIRCFGIDDNADLLQSLRVGTLPNGILCRPDVVVVEQMQYYGMAVGREVFDTVHWAGRFTEAAHPVRVEQMSRKAVAAAICNDARAKDANVHLALLDRYGGKATAVGRKAAPGPLYGISKDVWSALAIAVTYAETTP